jgi:sugar-specific transcriptional regulator TrmB
MEDGTLEDRLRTLGLSEKEVDTYLTLLELGEAKASTVADAAGVSKRYVYSVSEELAERGFVSLNDHAVPTTVRAKPPAEVVESLTRGLEEMRPALEARYSRAAPRSDRFEVVKSRATVLRRVRELVADAETEVTLAVPCRLLDEVAPALRSALERGVLVLLIVTDAGPDADADLDGLASVARAWEQPMPTMLTVDQRSGLVAPSDLMTRADDGGRAIVFAQEQLGPVLVGSFLGNYWPMATEVYTRSPDDLPATYRDFRHAVLQATLHHRAGRQVTASVRGRPVRVDDGPSTLDGVVVDVRQGLLEPPTNSFPVENSIVVVTEGGTLSVGGRGAFVEDFEAESVRLTVTE